MRVIGTLLLALSSSPAIACTTFMLSKDGPTIVAKSYDWNHDDGIVHRNPAGLKKRGLVLSREDRALEWESRYASLTFNQYGREMPNGGMNDAGLVVEIMWLSGAGWPGRDDRPALNELQWIQYQLDMHATTHDVIAAADQIRVAPIHGEVHYMVCDASAECASFEYLEGDLVIHHGDQLEIPALTNHTYDQSLAYARARDGVPASKGSGSLNRFHRAAEATVGVSSLETAWEVLKAVQWDRTQWQIVYEPEALTVHFKTRGNRKIRSISLKSMPTSCGSPVPVLSMQASLSGHVESSFVEFDPVANEALVQISVGELDATLPQGVVQAVSEISAHLMCAN